MESEKQSTRFEIIAKGITIWVIIILAEIIHGILRAIILVPNVGEFRSNQIGVFTGSAIILAIAYFTIRWIGAKSRLELLMVGAIWLFFTVTFELCFGRLVVGLSWERLGADYNVLNGGLMPIGLLVLFFSPMITVKLRDVRK
ncbi:hypothetical protein Poly41_52170 [Novipirellula artificiosorum]|uniref:Uncharacterized protein n=2 Tax=Novipirellula artificiosorum TaxID=2528016 RepID=A0A5C6D7P3_9BACT|nr:hypothetical protein Poly41_52170 [Novipirellula artificiosorum]